MTKEEMIRRAVSEKIASLTASIRDYKNCTQPGNRSDALNEADKLELRAYLVLQNGGYTRKAKDEMSRASWLRKSAEKYGP